MPGTWCLLGTWGVEATARYADVITQGERSAAVLCQEKPCRASQGSAAS